MERTSDRSTPLFAALFCWLVSVVALLLLSWIAWALKDGLRPGFVPSEGRVDLARFWIRVRWQLPIPIGIFLCGCLLYYMAYSSSREA